MAVDRLPNGRWPKGVSGNPKRGPGGRQSIEATVRRILDEQLPVGHPVRLTLEPDGKLPEDATRRDAVARAFVSLLLSGDLPALRMYLDREWPATQKVLLEDDTRTAPEVVEDADHVELVKAALSESEVLH